MVQDGRDHVVLLASAAEAYYAQKGDRLSSGLSFSLGNGVLAAVPAAGPRADTERETVETRGSYGKCKEEEGPMS